MTILEKIKFEEDWLSEVSLTKENIKIAFGGIRATALEQQPCEDCISREDAMNMFWNGTEGYDCRGFTRMDIGEILDNLPSVTPQPKMGHWEYVQYDYNPNIGNWHCSECRNIVIECANKTKKGGIPTYNYCPNCGADMRGEEE